MYARMSSWPTVGRPGLPIPALGPAGPELQHKAPSPSGGYLAGCWPRDPPGTRSAASPPGFCPLAHVQLPRTWRNQGLIQAY